MPVFRAKARAVELLGKGQIADLPTAISELWKNGYDAYADNLSCDLFLANSHGNPSPIFTLSDDGIGMSDSDILEKWIVLGTDSKVRDPSKGKQVGKLGKEYRVPMGEKGIGRLSVSYLGSQMLMLTRKAGHPLQALFMDWDILENFNLYLDEVTIPLSHIGNVNSVNYVFEKLLDEFATNLPSQQELRELTNQEEVILSNPPYVLPTTNESKSDWREHVELGLRLHKKLKELRIPSGIIERCIEPLLAEDAHGTTFIIFDPHDQLLEVSDGQLIDIDRGKGGDAPAEALRKSLVGIYNAFTKQAPPFQTSFWIHDEKGKYDLIAASAFFTLDDIFEADHWLTGEFDENGFFSGELQVFNQRLRHTFRPARPPGKRPYGPFEIKFGYVEGNVNSSKLTREQWQVFGRKLRTNGALYIYRDNFRVLPYGRTEYDFLRFEERRSEGAGYYMFSHRRMFGYIGLTRQNNARLVDKAGREGFISNKAYREFIDDLIEFFVDLAALHFRVDKKLPQAEKSLRDQQLSMIQAENKRLQEAEKKRSRKTKRQFLKELSDNSERIDELANELQQLASQLEKKANEAFIIYNEVNALSNRYQELKSELNTLRLRPPSRAKLTKRQERTLGTYNETYKQVLQTSQACNTLVESIQTRLPQQDLKREFENRYDLHRRDIRTLVGSFRKRVQQAFVVFDDEFARDGREFEANFTSQASRLELNETSSRQAYESGLTRLDTLHDETVVGIEEKYDSFTKHVENLDFGIDDDLLVGWYKNEFEKISQQVEAMHELSQLGMAIEIVDHQFNVLYAEMSSAIKFFRDYTTHNPELERNYQQLRKAFEHLESNHQLLTPLYRTTRRTRTEFSGREIEDYLRQFFANRLSRHNVQLKVDDSFRQYEFFTFESVIKATFINILNNALYWLRQSADRQIYITVDGQKILIMNSGKPIESAYLEDIFGLFFTRRPGGRGIGLYLARTNLGTIGYDIYATNDVDLNRLNGACFVIQKHGEGNEL